MASPRFLAGAGHRTFRVVTVLPTEHGAGEDVVEDLPAAGLVGSEDAVVRECLDDGPDLGLGRAAESADPTPGARISSRTA